MAGVDRVRTSSLLALTLALAITLAGCGSSGDSETAASGGESAEVLKPTEQPQAAIETSSPGFDATEVFERASPGVVTIRSIFGLAGAAEGSGFVVDGRAPSFGPVPALGQHTDAILAEFALAQWLTRGLDRHDAGMVAEAEAMLAELEGDVRAAQEAAARQAEADAAATVIANAVEWAVTVRSRRREAPVLLRYETGEFHTGHGYAGAMDAAARGGAAGSDA